MTCGVFSMSMFYLNPNFCRTKEDSPSENYAMDYLFQNKTTFHWEKLSSRIACSVLWCFLTSFGWCRHKDVDILLGNIIFYLKALRKTEVVYF